MAVWSISAPRLVSYTPGRAALLYTLPFLAVFLPTKGDQPAIGACVPILDILSFISWVLIGGRVTIALENISERRIRYYTPSQTFSVLHPGDLVQFKYSKLCSDLNWPWVSRNYSWGIKVKRIPSWEPFNTTMPLRAYHSACKLLWPCFEEVFLPFLGAKVPLQELLESVNYQFQLSILAPHERKALQDAIESDRSQVASFSEHMPLPLAAAVADSNYLSAYKLTTLATPIHRLPVELIFLIFLFIFDQQDTPIDVLMRVCRKWHGITASMRRSLKLGTWTPLDSVSARIGDGGWLLDVTIDPQRDVESIPHAADEERYSALHLAMFTSISRWRSLTILSLPTESPNRDIQLTTMNHLRSLDIAPCHDPSQFLDVMLPSIGRISLGQLTDVRVCVPGAIAYLAQPHSVGIFSNVKLFKVLLPVMSDTVDVLPYLYHLEVFEATKLCLPTYHPSIDLPLTNTLRQMSLKSVSVDWMNQRKFHQLESCRIVSPPALAEMPIVGLPVCRELYFEGLDLAAIRNFSISSTCTLALRSPQWSSSRGNHQLFRLWGAVPNQGVLRPKSLNLHLICGGEQLSRALYSIPELKTLVLHLDRPITLGTRFFMAFLPPSLQVEFSHKCTRRGKKPLQACPSLETLGLNCKRWFRAGESNELLALAAFSNLIGVQGRKFEIWVEKGANDQERVQIDCSEFTPSALDPLGLLRQLDGRMPQSRVLEEIIDASSAIFNPASIVFSHPETLTWLSPSTYSHLFRSVRDFTLHSDADPAVLFEVLRHFENLEFICVKRLSLFTSRPHLPLLKSLKKMQLGTTSLLWMEGCTFVKLKEVGIDDIESEGDDQLRRISMPECISASLPSSSPDSFNVFDMPQLHSLYLHGTGSDTTVAKDYRLRQQPRPRTASSEFRSYVALRALRDALATKPELEVLKISDFLWLHKPVKGLFALLDILGEPLATGDGNRIDHVAEPLSGKSLLCPKLKVLNLDLVGVNIRRKFTVAHRCDKFMKQRMKQGRPLQCFQLGCGSFQYEPQNSIPGMNPPGLDPLSAP